MHMSTQMKPTKEHKRQVELFPSKPFIPLKRKVDDGDLNFLESKLKHGNVVCNMEWFLHRESEPLEIADLIKLFSFPNIFRRNIALDDAVKAASISPADIQQIEQMTRGQHLNSNWHEMRRFRLTASNFGVVIKAIERQSLLQQLTRK